MRFLTFVLLGLSCLPAMAQTSSPQAAAKAFYDSRLGGNTSMGAPSGLELATYSTYLGPELVCLLGAAKRYNDAFMEKNPSSVAPFAHGDLYSGAEEQPASFDLGKPRINGQRATMTVHFVYDLDEGLHFERQNTLHMLLHKRRWVINDIEFGQPPAIDLKAAELVGGLREALNHANPDIGWKGNQLDGCPVDGELARLKAAQQRTEARAASRHGSRSHASKAHSGKAKAKSSTRKPATTKKKATNSARKKSASGSKSHR